MIKQELIRQDTQSYLGIPMIAQDYSITDNLELDSLEKRVQELEKRVLKLEEKWYTKLWNWLTNFRIF